MNKALKLSIKILSEFNSSIQEITDAATQTYRDFSKDQTRQKAVIMYSVYAYLIIKVSAFHDELTNQFEKLEMPKTAKELREAIRHFKKLYKIYRVYKYRNLMAHNRKAVRVTKPLNRKIYKYITNADIMTISVINSPVEFESFSVATNRIVKSLEKINLPN